jgi:hypothetical protein
MKSLYSLTWYLILSLFIVPNTLVEAKEDPFYTSIVRALTLQDSGSKSNGRRLECIRISARDYAANINLSANKIQELEDSCQAFLEFDTSGFSPGERYTFYSANMACHKTLIGEFVADSEGRLISMAEKIPLQGLQVVLNGFMQGEPSYYVLVSADKQTYVAGYIIPYPIEFEWSDEAYVSLTQITPDGDLFILSGKGFKPKESLVVTNQSFGHSLPVKVDISSEGKFFILHKSIESNPTDRLATITIERNQFKKVGKLNYVWGNAVDSGKIF